MKIKCNKVTLFNFRDVEKKISMYDVQIIQYHE